MKTHRFAPVAGALVVVISLSLPGSAGAQDVSESLGLLARENAELYLAPVFEGLGAGLGNGISDDASVHAPLGFDFGVRAIGAFVPEEAETFDVVLPSQVTFEGTTYEDPYEAEGGSPTTPTVVGDGDGIVLVPSGDFRDALVAAPGEDPDDPQWRVPLPQGYDIPAVPFVVLQGSLGVGFNTELSVRAIPSVEADEDVGSVKAFGLGGVHEVSGWFPAFPVILSVSAGYQDFSVGEYLDAKTTSLGLMAGKRFGPLDLFAIGEQVSPEVDVTYTVENEGNANPALPEDGTVISFSPDLPSETRFGVGANVRFLVLNLSAQYSLGDYNVATAKVGFSFR